MRQECSAEEIKALNKAMWGIVAELKALIAPTLPQDFQPLAGRKADCIPTFTSLQGAMLYVEILQLRTAMLLCDMIPRDLSCCLEGSIETWKDACISSRDHMFRHTCVSSSCVADDVAVSLKWGEICQQLQEATHTITAGTDFEALGRQLVIGPQSSPEPEPELVSDKVSKLCQHLMYCKASMTTSYCTTSSCSKV